MQFRHLSNSMSLHGRSKTGKLQGVPYSGNPSFVLRVDNLFLLLYEVGGVRQPPANFDWASLRGAKYASMVAMEAVTDGPGIAECASGAVSISAVLTGTQTPSH